MSIRCCSFAKYFSSCSLSWIEKCCQYFSLHSRRCKTFPFNFMKYKPKLIPSKMISPTNETVSDKSFSFSASHCTLLTLQRATIDLLTETLLTLEKNAVVSQSILSACLRRRKRNSDGNRTTLCYVLRHLIYGQMNDGMTAS